MVSVLHGGLGGDVDYISISWTGVDKVDSEEVRRELLKSRGGTQTDTGYLMWFGGQEHLRLSVADMKGILEPYAVPESGLESLPVHARSLLEESGNLQFLGSYDPDAGVFENVVVDWREQATGERLAELLERHELTVHEAVDYYVVEEVEQYTPAEWSGIRDVEDQRSVQARVEDVASRVRGTDEPESESQD
jgi:hypothetical protein